jgi:hypothetical protein
MQLSGHHQTPRLLYPRGKSSWYPVDRRLGGSHNCSGRCEPKTKKNKTKQKNDFPLLVIVHLVEWDKPVLILSCTLKKLYDRGDMDQCGWSWGQIVGCVSIKCGEILASRATVSFSRRTLIYGASSVKAKQRRTEHVFQWTLTKVPARLPDEDHAMCQRRVRLSESEQRSLNVLASERNSPYHVFLCLQSALLLREDVRSFRSDYRLARTHNTNCTYQHATLHTHWAVKRIIQNVLHFIPSPNMTALSVRRPAFPQHIPWQLRCSV